MLTPPGAETDPRITMKATATPLLITVLLGLTPFAVAWASGRRHSLMPVYLRQTAEDEPTAADTHLAFMSRRTLMQQLAGVSLATIAPADAIMTDETTSFANPATDASYKQQTPSSISFTQTTAVPVSDEVTFTITKADLKNMQGGLGLELGEVSFRTNFRVVIKSVAPNSLAERLGIQKDYVVVSVNGADAERTNAAGVAIYFSRAVKSVLNSSDGTNASLSLTFRDPSRFRDELKNFPTTDAGDRTGDSPTVSTKVAPSGDTTQRREDGSLRPGASLTEQSDQVITITQLIPPKLCTKRATTDDLLEISYVSVLRSLICSCV
jgi:hypothetical protein